jgi:hypothetical protein
MITDSLFDFTLIFFDMYYQSQFQFLQGLSEKGNKKRHGMFPATCGGLGPRQDLGRGQATVNWTAGPISTSTSIHLMYLYCRYVGSIVHIKY